MGALLSLILAALVGLAACAPRLAEPQSGAAGLTYLTEENAPLNFTEGGLIKGLSIELLELILARMNAGVSTSEKVKVVAWADGYQRALKEKNTVLFTTFRLPERETLFKWVGPVAPGTVAALSLARRKLSVKSVSELSKYRIGVVKDGWAESALRGAGLERSQLQEMRTTDELATSLQAGTIDVMVHSELASRWAMRRAGGDPSALDTVLALQQAESYYAFHKETPDEIVRSFQEALDALKRDKGADGVTAYEKVLYRYSMPRYARDSFTQEQVVALVERTAADIARDTPSAFQKINAGEPPYRDKQDPALYVFVYDTNINVVAHAYRSSMVGENYRGKADISGKLFRDLIVAGALRNGSGWEDYVTTKADESGLFYKLTYYKLVKGSDGNNYVVGAGLFKERP